MSIVDKNMLSKSIARRMGLTISDVMQIITIFEDEIITAIKENKKELEMFKQLKDIKIVMPKWLEFDAQALTGKVLALPTREDIDLGIKEHLIIELYSR